METKTYSESRGLPRFDWRAWLTAAIKDEPSAKEWFMVRDQSNKWKCSPVAYIKGLPRSKTGMPKDDEVAHMALQFYHYIRERKWAKALHTLNRIEARSAEIIAEISKETESKHP